MPSMLICNMGWMRCGSRETPATENAALYPLSQRCGVVFGFVKVSLDHENQQNTRERGWGQRSVEY
jgi:hypothetical protein